MRTLTVIITMLAAAVSCIDAAPETETTHAKARPAADEALGALLAERGDAKAFAAAIATASKAGVSPQAMLEARFLYHVDRDDESMIASMVPDLLKQSESFKPENSAICAEKDDWLAIVEYARAVAALRASDQSAFKSHITEAFWLSPQQASAYAPLVERVRLKEAMRNVKMDFATRLQSIDAEAQSTSLESLMNGKKAMLLHFWSPRSEECLDSLPDFATTAELLLAHQIAVVSLMPNEGVDGLTEASKAIRTYRKKPTGEWLVDSAPQRLARVMKIRELPAIVLVSKDGNVLFNGSPSDEAFWKSLHSIDDRITRPTAATHHE